MTRLLLVDDHALVRAGLRQFLSDDAAISAMDEADSGHEALRLLRRQPYDLVVLDINLPDRSGLEILTEIRSGWPQTRVLVISAFPEKLYAVNVLRAGAHGYLDKVTAPEELRNAVHSILRGKRYLSANLAEALIDELDSDRDVALHARLSEREFQIFRKLAAGQSASSIGSELDLSVKTISTYRSRVLEKMGLKTNADLTAYAIRNGLMQ